MLKGRGQLWLLLALFLLMVGIYYSTGPNLRNLGLFTFLTLLLIISTVLTRHYYLPRGEKKPLKERIVSIFMFFIKVSIFYVALREVTGFTLNYSFIALFFVALTIFTLWDHLDLQGWEKGVLVLTLVTILGMRFYLGLIPHNPFQLYNSQLREIESFEEIQKLLEEDLKKEFTKEDFQEIENFLGQPYLQFNQPALIEFKEGEILLLEVARQAEHEPLRISSLERLPREISSYFLQYPPEMEREGDYPKDMEEEKIIEARGSFISRASFYQKGDWYEELLEVFGEKKVWEKLWEEIGDYHAPEGPVVGAGTSGEGYLHFSFHQDWEVDRKILDDIYSTFQEKAAQEGIQDLPVVFKWR